MRGRTGSALTVLLMLAAIAVTVAAYLMPSPAEARTGDAPISVVSVTCGPVTLDGAEAVGDGAVVLALECTTGVDQ